MSESRALLIRGARLVVPGCQNEPLPAGLRIQDTRIAAIGECLDPPSEIPVVDASGLVCLPGFLDVHIHGGGGRDTMDASVESLRTIARAHARFGTTGFFATTITQSDSAISAALSVAAGAVGAGREFCFDGARILGIHLEGPYIHPDRPGAQPREFVRDFDPGEFAKWLEMAKGTMRRITLAPERPGADRLMECCRKNRIAISFGHTDATYSELLTGMEKAGAADATHLFNAMAGIHHRKPGPIPAFLTDSRAHVEIIADGHHVDPAVIAMAVAARGADRVIAITDAMAGAGAPEGVYELGGHAVTVESGRATLTDGTLAGSVLTMDRAAKNLREWCGLTWEQVALVTSGNAAQRHGFAHKGRISVDTDADLVLVDPVTFNVHATIVAGDIVFSASEK